MSDEDNAQLDESKAESVHSAIPETDTPVETTASEQTVADESIKVQESKAVSDELQDAITTSDTPAVVEHETTSDEKADYFESAHKQSDADHDATAVERQDSTTSKAPSISSVATTPEITSRDSFQQSSSSAQKRRPGWKGWLRSASSATINPVRADPVRKQLSGTASSQSSERFQMLETSFQKVRSEVNDNLELDWAYYEKLLLSPSPRELLQSSPYIRVGVSDHFRGFLWQAACQSKSQDIEDVFAELKLEPSSAEDKQISKDLSRMNKAWLKLLDKHETA